MEEESKNNLKELRKDTICAIIPAVLNILLNFGFCGVYFLFSSHTPTLYFSFVIMYLIYAIVLVFVKKTHRATYIISALILIFSVINDIKMVFTSTPIYPSDIYFLGNIGEIAGIVKGDILSHISYLQHGILLVLLIGTCILARMNSITVESKKIRVITAVSVILVFTIMLVPINAKDQFILKTIYNTDGREDYEMVSTDFMYYTKYSVLAGMYGLELENRKTEPENYNEEEVINELNEADKSDITEKDLGKPNIIVMFQESYFDIENIEEVEFDRDITANFKNLQEKENGINLLSASYGGLSSNIEFELLTGANIAYFPTGYNPFTQLYKEKDANNKPSIIKELKNNGYYTKVVFGRDYYASKNIYKKLGIDEYANAYTDMPDYEEKIKGTYISDEALVDDVIDTLKNNNTDKPIFYMTATVQTHMPFSEDKYEEYDISIKNSSLSEEENGIILSYAQGIYDTNLQIQRLYEEIQKIEEPTIIVVLGDHLPYLYNEAGEDILGKLSYFNTEDDKVNLLRKYTTPGLVLSNYNVKMNFDSEYISPDMLLTSIVNRMDIELSPYYKWIYKIKNVLPAQNRYLTIDAQGQIYYMNEEMPKEMENAKKLRENMQYYLFEK